jgi:hypothetical protein
MDWQIFFSAFVIGIFLLGVFLIIKINVDKMEKAREIERLSEITAIYSLIYFEIYFDNVHIARKQFVRLFRDFSEYFKENTEPFYDYTTYNPPEIAEKIVNKFFNKIIIEKKEEN